MFKNSETSLLRSFDTDLFSVKYKGVFIYKNQIYEQAVRDFLTSSPNASFDFKNVRGNFSIQIFDKKARKTFYFTDNSGLYRIYYYKNILSDSFLDLIQQMDKSEIQLDYDSLVEFLHLGYVHFDRTLLKNVKFLNKNQYIIKSENGEIIVENKNIPLIEENTNLDFKNELSQIIKLFKGMKISADLTGGIDSRLIVSFLNEANLNFETATSGMPENTDVIIAEKVAQLINKDFYVTWHKADNVNNEDLLEIFQKTDSQIDVVRYHRNFQYNEERRERKIELMISGVGGELYKDFWWLQDFPFYRKKKSNIGKLYNLRIEGFNFPHNILNEKIKGISLEFRKRTIGKLEKFKQNFNTATYDKIYYDYKMRGIASAFLSTAGNYFNVYAPLMELDLVRIAFGLNRRERFFNNFHRRLITSVNLELAKILTTEGVSCSSKKLDLISDFFGYTFNKLKRLIKIFLRKFTKKSYLQETPDNPLVYQLIKEQPFNIKYEKLLKRYNIIDENIELTAIPNQYYGRFLTVAILIEFIENLGKERSSY